MPQDASMVEIFLRLPQGDLFLGESKFDHRLPNGGCEAPAIILHFYENLGPDTAPLSGRKLVIPLQAITEFVEE